jgi:ABC-2 type transport system permease protein
LVGWLVAMLTCGAVFGSIAKGIGDLVGDSERAQEMFERLGGSAALVDAFLAALAGIYGMIVAFYGVQATVRLRTEETAGRAEPLLATRVRRLQWAASHLVFAFGGTAAMLLVAGAATGLTHGLRTGTVGDAVGDNVVAAAAQIPATWLVVAIGVTLFGVAPRLTVAAWAVAGTAVAIGLFAPVLDVPQVVLDLSPFSHIPKLPGADVTALPLAALTAAGGIALAMGLGGFRRRDIG